jgi:hypothetical protein
MKPSKGGRPPTVTLWHGWRSKWVDRHEYALGSVALLLAALWAVARYA